LRHSCFEFVSDFVFQISDLYQGKPFSCAPADDSRITRNESAILQSPPFYAILFFMITYHPIFLGSHCNNECIACPSRDREKTCHLNALFAQIDQLDGLADCQNVTLVGGEPLLYKGLFPLVTHARHRGAKRIKLVTNGRRLADRDFLERLLEEGGRIFDVKIWGSTAQTHDSVTGVWGSFDETMQGMNNLADLCSSQEYQGAVFVTASIGVTSTNMQDLTATMVLAASLGADRIVLARRGTDFPIAEGARIVSNVLRTATLNRVWSMCEGCEAHMAELLQPRIYPGDKPVACRTCACRDICSGPPEDYAGKHGTKEFVPVAVARYLDDVTHLARTLSAHATA
jgi:wyosine [tRNA(Phe)-imidazoG37] synthetase (radical SAM superfamily)